ncbi:MAG: PP2C family protein-serine/threonine phosphatase, partial [Nitrospinota bacterium]
KGRFEVNAFTKSAHAVGGDLYCITRLPDGQLGIALGDVSGKGVPAALYMARMISEFRLFSAQSASVQEVVEKLNQALAQRSMRGMFVTFAYGTLAPDTGLLRMVNAGHLPPIRVGADGAVQPVAAAGGPPLGVVPGLSYQEQAVQLAPGDRILLYSDGILEARGVGGEEFGEQRILDVASSSKKGADGLLKGVLDAVKEFSSGTPQMDDMTLIAAAWTGKGE